MEKNNIQYERAESGSNRVILKEEMLVFEGDSLEYIEQYIEENYKVNRKLITQAKKEWEKANSIKN